MSRIYTQDELEEKFRWMRERQQLKRDIRAGTEAPARSLTPIAHRRRERRRAEGVPAHLDMYRVSEVAEMLGVSRHTVEKWFRDYAVVVESESGPRRPRRTMLISRAALETWVRAHHS